MAAKIWKILNFSEFLEVWSLAPKGPNICQNYFISYGFSGKLHFPFPTKFKKVAEIQKSIGFTLQTSITRYIRVISTFKFCYSCLTLKGGPRSISGDFSRISSTVTSGYPHLTLKKWPKVKFDCIRKLLAHDFLWVGFT